MAQGATVPLDEELLKVEGLENKDRNEESVVWRQSAFGGGGL